MDNPFTSSSLKNSNQSSKRLESPEVVVSVTVIFLYLIVGALDWFLMVDLIIKSVKSFFYSELFDPQFMSGLSTSDVTEVMNAITQSVPTGTSSFEGIFTISFLYFVFYVQRHSYLLQYISYVGIKWDQGLFSDP